MRLKFRILLVLLLVVWGTSIASSQTKTVTQPCSESSFKRKPTLNSVFNPRLNKTEVQLSLPRSTCEDYGMWISFYYSGRESKMPKEIVFGVISVFCPPNEKSLACYNLNIVLDDTLSLPLGELIGTGMHVIYDADGSLSDRYVMLPVNTFMQIAKARKIHIVIGAKQFDLSERDREAMRQLADSIKAAG